MTVRGRGGRRSKAQLEADARYSDYLDRCAEAADEWDRRHPLVTLFSYLIPAVLVVLLSICDIGEEKLSIGTVLIRLIVFGVVPIPLASRFIRTFLSFIIK